VLQCVAVLTEEQESAEELEENNKTSTIFSVSKKINFEVKTESSVEFWLSTLHELGGYNLKYDDIDTIR